MKTQLKSGQIILFIGDSITDCGRLEPQHRPLGCGYVQMIADMLAVRDPEKQVHVINTGIGGNTLEDLRSCWIDDALSYRPDWLSIKIGINDCNRWLSNESVLQSPEKFAEYYDELLALTVKSLPDTKLLFIDPFFAGLDEGQDLPDSYRSRVLKTLPRYLETVNAMSAKYNTLHVRMHAGFQEHFKLQHPSRFFPNEPVHPNSAGQMLIAESVYTALSAN
ncbi:Acetylxylan esterase [Pontiella desulfatans]|uniref:Acetylxylan esterase n=1 Tax=Pontiella desulfatans TaxID=2750659 RepID=A0A6C2U4S7_PONDE|nr:SGNH/GDSL hydrolase family protein [Pontiella desulfatans]VGO15068.1 Acetylxylan esterase [Pontiella desulfatans]